MSQQPVRVIKRSEQRWNSRPFSILKLPPKKFNSVQITIKKMRKKNLLKHYFARDFILTDCHLNVSHQWDLNSPQYFYKWLFICLCQVLVTAHGIFLWRAGLAARQHVWIQFPDQGWNPSPLHWQADSWPLDRRESFPLLFIGTFLLTHFVRPRRFRSCRKHSSSSGDHISGGALIG